MENDDFAKRIYYAMTADDQATPHVIAKSFSLLMQHLVSNGSLTHEAAVQIVDESIR